MDKQGLKAITRIPGWAENFNRGSNALHKPALAYAKVPLIRRAVELRCNSLASLPFEVLNQAGDPVGWQFDTEFRELLWQTEAALLITGAAYWLKTGGVLELAGRRRVRLADPIFVNPHTVRVDYNQGSDTVTFVQEVGGQPVVRWQRDEVVYFREYNPTDDIKPGVGAVENAILSAEIMHALNQFAYYYFDGGAMPVVLLGVESNVSRDEIDKLQNYFKRMMTGLKNAMRVIGIRGGITPQVLTPPLDTLAMPELSTEARQQVAWSFGVPLTLLTDAANYATAENHRLSFYQETIVPRAHQLAATINREFYGGVYELVWQEEQLDLFQTDEASRAGSLQQLVNAGIPLITAMEILGYDLSDEQWLTIPEVADTEPVTLDDMAFAPGRAQLDETRSLHLDQWERKALSSLKSGRGAAVPFVSDAIIEPERVAIETQLALCYTEAEVKAVFS
jgi:HK97 family phage portal protein